MRRHLALSLAYQGTAYHGFQVQKNALTVAEVLQNAIRAALGSREEIKGCSRTDAGVHALAYCVSFFTDSALPCEKLPLALNAHLPEDIRVFSAREVGPGFHARYSCTGKAYLYRVRNAPAASPFSHQLAWRVWPRLELEPMRRAAALLCGRHDFASFMAAGSTIAAEGGSTVRTVRSFAVEQKGDELRFMIEADGYLYNMVRILVGTLVEVGAGRRDPEAMPAVLAACDRAAAGQTAPAKGLALAKVFYDEFTVDGEGELWA